MFPVRFRMRLAFRAARLARPVCRPIRLPLQRAAPLLPSYRRSFSTAPADVELQLQSEEIQKLLKVVDLYLAGGKQQRDVSPGEAGQGWLVLFAHTC